MCRRILLSLAMCARLSIFVHGQGPTTGTIGGYVYDGQRAVLSGVTLTATSTTVPRTYTATSDSSGYYRLTDLPPGTYTVTADHPGFATFRQDDILVGTGSTLGLEVVMSLATVTETVEVRHRAPPMLEINQPGQSNNISGDFQRATPINRSNEWSEFMMLIPGSTLQAEQTIRQGYFFHGADQSSHVVLLDGADVLPAIFNGTSYATISSDMIADTNVTTAIADASAPLGVGAVANVVSRSGTNNFHGTGAFAYRSLSWNASNVPNGTSAAAALMEPDASLGGPVSRDRIWFFGSYQYRRIETGISRSAVNIANLKASNPSFAPFNNIDQASLLFGKVTARLGDGTLTGSAQSDRETYFADTFQSTNPLNKQVIGGPWVSTQLLMPLRGAFQLRVSASYNTKRVDNALVNPSSPSHKIYSSTTLSNGRRQGVGLLGITTNGGQATVRPDAKTLFSADITKQQQAFGTHDLKLGIYFQHNRELQGITLANQGQYLIEEVLRDANNPSQGTVAFHKQTAAAASLLSTNDRAKDVAIFFQDAWRPTSRISATGGVRIDRITRRDLLFGAGNQDSVAVGPRAGVAVLLDEAGHNVAHVAAGRIHDALSITRNYGVGASTFTLQDDYDLDLNGSFETTFVSPGSSAASQNFRIDPNLRQPYVNDLSAGYRRQLTDRTTLDITWSRRAFQDQLAYVDVNAIYDGVIFTGYRDVTQNAITQETNNIWNRPLYGDVTLQVTHRTAGIQWLGSYSRQWQRLVGTWQPNDPSSFLQPSVFPDDKYNPLAWRDHAARMAGTINLPWRLRVAGDYSFQSGKWSGPITMLIAAPDPAFGPPRVTLSNGRVVSNPLATTTRFAYATRGANQLRGSALNIVNATLVREVPLPIGRVELQANLFNVFNVSAPQLFSDTNLSSATFGQVRFYQLPRAVQVGLRLSY